MEIKIFEDKESLNRAFTRWLKEILLQKEILTLSLSGGSTPTALFDYWTKYHRTDIDWRRFRFFWGDERCVPPTEDQSNYKMTREHLFDPLGIPEKNVFRMYGENIPEIEAKRYAGVLRQELEICDGFPSFDLLMLGMGDDGHTASIFPHEIELWNSPEICVVGTHPVSRQKRVSLSGKTINAAQRIAFLVTDKNKAEKVKEVVESFETSAKKYPAALVQPESGNLTWFLDKEAGSQLKEKTHICR